jgi:predicted DNA-binding transcriptional regulator AlpA
MNDDRWVDFNELVAKGVVRNRVTLARWIKTQNFPAGTLLGPNTRRWRASTVEEWCNRRGAVQCASSVAQQPQTES